MRMRDLIEVRSIRPDGVANDKADVLNQMVELMSKSGLREKRKVLPVSARELRFRIANQRMYQNRDLQLWLYLMG